MVLPMASAVFLARSEASRRSSGVRPPMKQASASRTEN